MYVLVKGSLKNCRNSREGKQQKNKKQNSDTAHSLSSFHNPS